MARAVTSQRRPAARTAQAATRVTAAIIAQADRILVARRRSSARHAAAWEFPGGKIEPGETPRQCLKREIKEELNLTIAVGRRAGEVIHHYPDGAIRLTAFYATIIAGTPVAREHEEIAWVPVKHLGRRTFLPADRPLIKILQGRRLKLET